MDRINGAGGEVIAISVNEEERQAGMIERWGLSSMQLISDPGGEKFLVPMELFNPDERGGIALPGMLVISPEGEEVYRYKGRDFADRTTDDEVLEALEGLGLDAVSPEPSSPSMSVSDDLRGFFRASDYGTYFRGNRFGALAIRGRLPNKETAAIAGEHAKMCEASLEAWDAHRATFAD